MENKEKKMSYASEGLAVPEIRFEQEEFAENVEEESDGIHYENVAVPEIHVKKKKIDRKV